MLMKTSPQGNMVNSYHQYNQPHPHPQQYHPYQPQHPPPPPPLPHQHHHYHSQHPQSILMTSGAVAAQQAPQSSVVVQHQSANTMHIFENTVDADSDDDDVGEPSSTSANDHDQYLYLSTDLSPHTVQKLKTLSLEQCNYLKQLGILSIQFDNEKYGLSLMSPPKRRRRSSPKLHLTASNRKEESSTTNAGLTSTSFAYIPTSGLILDEQSQYTSLGYAHAAVAASGGAAGKQQFTMPCPMLKNLLKTDSNGTIIPAQPQMIDLTIGLQQQQHYQQPQSDELMRILKLRQALANQTQQEIATAAVTTTVSSSTTTTTTKKPRARNTQPSDKPKQKRTTKAQKAAAAAAAAAAAGSTVAANAAQSSTVEQIASEGAKKDHIPQEKIRNILNEQHNYQQMNMMQQQQQAPQQQQINYQINQISTEITMMKQTNFQNPSATVYVTTSEQLQQQQHLQVNFMSQQQQQPPHNNLVNNTSNSADRSVSIQMLNSSI